MVAYRQTAYHPFSYSNSFVRPPSRGGPEVLCRLPLIPVDAEVSWPEIPLLLLRPCGSNPTSYVGSQECIPKAILVQRSAKLTQLVRVLRYDKLRRYVAMAGVSSVLMVFIHHHFTALSASCVIPVIARARC